MHDTHTSTAARRDPTPTEDLALAQEAHDLISLFLDIEDAQVRRRCIDYVRRAASGMSPPIEA